MTFTYPSHTTKGCVPLSSDVLETFIISPSKFDDILKDNVLLKYLKKSNKDIVPYINISREVGTNKIYLAFVNLPAKVERFLAWYYKII